MTNIIGLDLSLTATGICADGQLVTIKTGSTHETIAARNDRLSRIIQGIERYVPLHSAVFIEGPSLGQSRQGGEHLRAGLWWRVAAKLLVHRCHLVEISPASLKKFATGKGNAPKGDMRMALYKRAGIDCADDNQVDAWWLWQAGLHLTGDPAALKMPAVNMSGLDKVLH